MSKEMMICPKAKECKKFDDDCMDAKPHKKNDSCTLICACPACIPYIPEEYECTAPEMQGTCLAIMPNEEHCNGCRSWQPKKPCPECGHKINEHYLGICCHVDNTMDGRKSCLCHPVPADPAKPTEPSPFVHELLMRQATEMEAKRHCEHEWHPITQGTWNCTKCGEPYYDKSVEATPSQMPLITMATHYPNSTDRLNATFFNDGAYCQRDADMAWHNEKVQQVRKAFALEVCAYLKEALNIISPSTEEKVQEHIRAMAGK